MPQRMGEAIFETGRGDFEDDTQNRVLFRSLYI
jgi:hypothetical protein